MTKPKAIKSKLKQRKPWFMRWKTKVLFDKVRQHYEGQHYIHNLWTETKHGVHELKDGILDFDQMYMKDDYVCSNGIPLYNIKKKTFQVSWRIDQEQNNREL